jgi:hypothetical protein
VPPAADPSALEVMQSLVIFIFFIFTFDCAKGALVRLLHNRHAHTHAHTHARKHRTHTHAHIH